MGFKDSWMGMADTSVNWREAWLNYALSPRDAVGVGSVYMRSDDQTRNRLYSEVTLTRLAHRWNMPHAQANLWAVVGAGVVSGNDFAGHKTLLSPGLQADFETARVYVSANHRLYRASGLKHDYSSARAGFSFYESEYDETQPWLIVEVRRMRDLSAKLEITPMLRLINKQFFVELGVSNNRQARFNFMYIF
jgi:hypothetical protein